MIFFISKFLSLDKQRCAHVRICNTGSIVYKRHRTLDTPHRYAGVFYYGSVCHSCFHKNRRCCESRVETVPNFHDIYQDLQTLYYNTKYFTFDLYCHKHKNNFFTNILQSVTKEEHKNSGPCSANYSGASIGGRSQGQLCQIRKQIRPPLYKIHRVQTI